MSKMIKIEGYELLSQKIYRALKTQIVKGFLEPGEKLYGNEIAKDLNVSRTPVREALQRLASEGFLNITPNKAMVIVNISFEDAKEVLQVRGVLEGLAARITANKISKAELKELNDIIQKMDSSIEKNNLILYCKLDDEFHELILNICENKWIIRMRDSLENFIYRFRVKSLSIKGRIEDSLEEHKKIMESLKEHNSEKAEQSSRKHMENTINNIMKNLLRE